MNGRTVTRHARAAIEQKAARLIAAERLAQNGQVALAVETVAAMRIPRTDDMVAGTDLRDLVTDRFDDARTLVPEHDRQRVRERTLNHFEIGVAQTARTYAHEHIRRRERRHGQRLDREGRVDLVEDGGLEVLAIKGLEVSKPVDQVKLPDYASYKVARELFRQHPDVDSLLIQGRWRSVAYVQELEDDTGKPVVSSTAAALWWVMQVLGMKASIEGYGKLLRG